MPPVFGECGCGAGPGSAAAGSGKTAVLVERVIERITDENNPVDIEKLLIVTHHLTIGGVQKTLISALKALDYNKYKVTLYLRKNRTDILDYVDKRIKVVINKSRGFSRVDFCVCTLVYYDSVPTLTVKNYCSKTRL